MSAAAEIKEKACLSGAIGRPGSPVRSLRRARRVSCLRPERFRAAQRPLPPGSEARRFFVATAPPRPGHLVDTATDLDGAYDLPTAFLGE